MPDGNGQVNFASFNAYHLLESGWVDEEIIGASGTPPIGFSVAGGAGGNLRDEIEGSPEGYYLKISVPKPSFARTASEDEIKDAEPAFLALKTILITLPVDPLNPGVGNPPLNGNGTSAI